MADETPLPVFTKDKPGATHKGYHWVYYDPVNKLVLFDYQKTRSREGPDKMLGNYTGYLQTDGYAAYTHFENRKDTTLLSCMAHARRKFEHAKDNVTRQVKELRGFQKVFLKKGDSKKLIFTLSNKDLSFYRKNMTYGSEPGRFEVFVGGSSDTKYKTSFMQAD